MEIEMDIELHLTPAEKMYANHLKNVSNYQKRNPEKMREKCRTYNERLKQEFPDKYWDMLQKKRDYYINVRKPILEQKKMEKPKIETQCATCPATI